MTKETFLQPPISTQPTRSKSAPLGIASSADEVDKAYAQLRQNFKERQDFDHDFDQKFDQNDDEKKNGKRKMGVYLTGAAAGSVVATWTYSEFRKESMKPPPTRREKFNFIADVVAETESAMVYIKLKNEVTTEIDYENHAKPSNGSGFIVQEDGLILTNAHVVKGQDEKSAIEVKLHDGRMFHGEIEHLDLPTDLATVRIKCQNLPVIKLGKSSDIRPGEFVIAMGSPLALSNTITTGVVSSVSRTKQELPGLENMQVPDFIQTDAAINCGNSGGPLINLDGQAIGINSMKFTSGISFAIPIDYVKEFLQKRNWKTRFQQEVPKFKRFMGLSMLAISPNNVENLRQKLDLPVHLNRGVIVYQVIKNSPADEAGLEAKDVIMIVNDIEISHAEDIFEILKNTNDYLYMKVLRRGQELRLTVKPK